MRKRPVKPLLTRFGLVAAFLLVLLVFQKKSPSPPPLVQTENPEVQLVRLFQQTHGTWSDAQQDSLNRLLTDRSDFEMISRRLPFVESPSIPVLWAVAQQQRNSLEWLLLEQTLKTILTHNPAHPEANLWMGLLLLPDSEGRRYIEIGSQTPHEKQPLAAALLGIVSMEGYTPADVALRLVEGQEWAFAERFLTHELEENSLNAWAYAYRGFVRDQQGKNGLPDIQQAIALEPTFALGFYMLGLHERQAGNLPASLNALQEAYLLEPDNPALAAEVAAGFQLAKEYESAENWFKLAVSFAPDDVRFVRLLAAFYAENAYLLDGRGLIFIQEAVQTYPDDVSLLASLGRAYLETGNLQDAETLLQQAANLAPNDPRTHDFLAMLAERQ